MSLPKRDKQISFTDVSFLAEDLFEPTSQYRLFRERFLPVLEKERAKLAQLYCEDNGRPAIEPLIMAGVSLLQFMEKIPDRKAAESVRINLGFKYALGLDLQYKGFHPTSLVNFRDRLLAGEAERAIFDAVLERLREEGLVKKRSKQRLDSTHVLGHVSQMSRLEVVRETLRLVLEEIYKQCGQSSLQEHEELVKRYRDDEVNWREQTKEQLIDKLRQAGLDALKLISWLRLQAPSLRDSDKALLLQRVFLEQYEITADGPQQRRSQGSGAVENPHDPEAQYAAKDLDKKKTWTGYKAQVMETVAEDGKPKDKGEPTEQFITQITTTEAIASDLDGMDRTLQAHREHSGEEPRELYTDTAYVSGKTLAEAKADGRELIGPARPCPRREEGLEADQFDVDVENRKAVCPAGKQNTQCSHIKDSHQKTDYYRFEWGSQCDDCPLQKSCTKSKQRRRILCVGPHHNLLQMRRKEMKTPEFKKLIQQRNGIEGTISELVRLGMRRSRYRGLAKTGLANYMLGAACNVNRCLRLMAWRIICVGRAA